jgi:hypothetical protein
MVYFIDPNELIKEFNEIINIAQKKAFLTVGIEIQKDEIENLENYQQHLAKKKKEFVEKRYENEANLIYCIEKSVKVIQQEIIMLVCLKEDKMANAWDILVDAQINLGNVIRNYPFDADFLNNYKKRLENYENLLFPKMMFHSAGGIIKKSECSICGEDFENCDHIKGKLYFGESCHRIIKEMELEEVSVVDNPANKHCRTLTIETNGKEIDILTLRETKHYSQHAI